MRLAWVQSPFAAAVNAIGAVHLFFVLSGYVLAGSAQRGRGAADLLQFYVRRVFRIHPPFAAALLLTWLLSLGYAPPGEGVSSEYRRHLQAALSPAELPAALLFPGTAGGLMPHGYTLAVEMIFSFLLPLMVLVSRRLHASVWIPLSLAGLWIPAPPYHWPRYGLDFALGIALYEERARLARAFGRMPRWATAALLAGGLALFTYPTYAIQPFSRASVVPFALGGAALVACAVHVPRVGAALSSRPVAALGRVSYSSYLLHFAILVWLTRLLERPLGVAGGAAFIALVAACTIAVSAASFRWLERPSIRLGNALCARLAAALGRRARPSRRFGEGAAG